MDGLILRCGGDELRSAAISPSGAAEETAGWTAAHLPLGTSPGRGAEKSIQQDGTFWDGEFWVPIAPLYRMSTSGGNGAGVLRTTDPKAKGHATRFATLSSAGPPLLQRSLSERSSLNEMDLLFLASVADMEGRTLDEPQRAAKQAYRLALGRVSVGAGHGSIAGFADIPDLAQIMATTSLRRLSDEDLQLLISGTKALEEGRPVGESEAVALQTSRREQERLCEMAGLGGTEKHPVKLG